MNAIWSLVTSAAVGFVLGNLTGFARTYRKGGHPFNWRVLVGPVIYGKWIAKQRVQ